MMKSTDHSPWSIVKIVLIVLINVGFLWSIDYGLWTAPAIALGTEPAGGQRWEFVRRVLDGDTVLLASGERVRYIGVDTPEMHRRGKPVEPYAREAKEFNRRLVEGKWVRLELDLEQRDRYGRLLAYVYLEGGTFVNAELLRYGYARLMTIPPNVKHGELFSRLQKEAREAKRGLWGRR